MLPIKSNSIEISVIVLYGFTVMYSLMNTRGTSIQFVGYDKKALDSNFSSNLKKLRKTEVEVKSENEV